MKLLLTLLFSLSAFAAPVGFYEPTIPGRVLLYNLESDGTDQGGFVNTLTNNNGGSISYVGGLVQNSAAYNVSALQGMICSDTHGLPLTTSARTLAAWIKMDDTNTASQVVVSYGNNTTGHRWGIYFAGNSGNWFQVECAGFGTSCPGGSKDTNWHHYAISYTNRNGNSVSSTNVCMWLDGVGKTVTGAINVLATSAEQIVISRAAGLTGNNFTGRVDSVMLFNRELSTNEVGLLYNGGAGYAH